MVTLERLSSILSYDENTGLFTWRVRQGRCAKGVVAGSPNKDGHIKIRIDKKYYLAHRLAWLYVYGSFPDSSIDHINRSPSDNRITNLRLANMAENQQNRSVSRYSKSGATGVYFDKFGQKWRAHITVDGKTLYLGSFVSKEDAMKARQEAKKTYHKFNPVDACPDPERKFQSPA